MGLAEWFGSGGAAGVDYLMNDEAAWIRNGNCSEGWHIGSVSGLAKFP